MMPHTLFAHAEEVHTSTSESFLHQFESAGFALAGWLFLVTFVVLIGQKALKLTKAQRMLALAVLHLVYGIFLYDKSPGIGALVVSTGFGLTLLTVLAGLQSEPAKKGKSTKKGT